MDCNYKTLIRTIDEFLVELSVQVLVDGRKARDHLLDLRSMCGRLEMEALAAV